MTADFCPVLLLAASGVVGLLLIPLGLPGLWLIVLGGAGRGVRGLGRLPIRSEIRRIEPSRLGRTRRRADWGDRRRARAHHWAVVGGFLGAFLGAAVFEYTRARQSGVAAKAGWGAVLGRAAAAAIKMAVGVVLVVSSLFLALRS
jgi:uncharacterized protein